MTSLGAGSSIGSYILRHDFNSGANCRWAIADRGGKEYFVKQFHKPKYPPDVLVGEIRENKLKRCKAFEDRHKKLVAGLIKVCAPGGNIVMPVDFFRLDLTYYHIAIKIDTTTLKPEQIARESVESRLMLIRLLARSLMTIHSQKIVHGDLKPDNILIKRSDGGILSPKIIDFDGSFFCGSPPDREDMAFDQNYMSPEVMCYNKEDFAGHPIQPEWLCTSADIFAVGILIHEYWTGRRPILPEGYLYTADAVVAGKEVKLNLPGLDPDLRDLVQRTFLLDFKKRPAIEEIDQAIGKQISRHRSGAVAPTTLTPVVTKPAAPLEPPPASGPTVRVKLGSFERKGTPSRPASGPTPASISAPVVETPTAPVVVRFSKNLKKGSGV